MYLFRKLSFLFILTSCTSSETNDGKRSSECSLPWCKPEDDHLSPPERSTPPNETEDVEHERRDSENIQSHGKETTGRSSFAVSDYRSGSWYSQHENIAGETSRRHPHPASQNRRIDNPPQVRPRPDHRYGMTSDIRRRDDMYYDVDVLDFIVVCVFILIGICGVASLVVSCLTSLVDNTGGGGGMSRPFTPTILRQDGERNLRSGFHKYHGQRVGPPGPPGDPGSIGPAGSGRPIIVRV